MIGLVRLGAARLLVCWGWIAAAALLSAPAAAQQGKGEAPYVPTPQAVVEAMLKLGRVGSGDYLIDLGSGDGRIVISAAKLGARGLGVDLDPVLLGLASQNAAREGVADRAVFRRENLFATDLTPATVVTTYLLPEMNLKLRPKILDLAPGTRLVAHDYHMGDWTPDERLTLAVPEKKVGQPGLAYVYLWVVPATIAGRWQSQLSVGGKRADFEFDLRQRYQMVNGTAWVNGAAAPLKFAALSADELRFTVDARVGGTPTRHEFRGRVKGGAIDGTVAVSAGSAPRDVPWSARLAQPARRDEQ